MNSLIECHAINIVDVGSKMYIQKRFIGSNNIKEADNGFALKSLII